jgi:hypothetical protein
MSFLSSRAASLGISAAMMLLTTATPSSPREPALDWYMTRWTFEALIPPMETVAGGRSRSRVERCSRMARVPAVPMMSFAFRFLDSGQAARERIHYRRPVYVGVANIVPMPR